MGGFEGLLTIAAAFFVAAASPGPANIALATIAMRSGRKSGLGFGLGLSVGLAAWGLVAATGLGAMLQTSAAVLGGLKIAGGMYLLWLAYQSARAAARPVAAVPTEPANVSGGRWFWRGLALNLSNPKAVFAWMAALSMGLGQAQEVSFLVLATVLCMAIGVLNYAGYALAFSLPGFMSGYARFSRWINGVVAGLFALAGLGLIRSAFTRAA